MLDIKFIRENKELIELTCKQKKCTVDIAKLIEVDDKRRELIQKSEELKAKKNEVSKKVTSLQGTEKEKILAEMKEVSQKEKDLDAELTQIKEVFIALMLKVPAPVSDKTPVGKDDTENVEMYKWGELPTFDFEPLDHVELGKRLDIIDIERGVKVAGSRTYFLKGDGARLELAILMFTLNKLIAKGFTAFLPPLLVNYDAMMGTSYFPGGEEQAYSVGVEKVRGEGIESDEKYLIGTAEVPVTSYHSGEILNEAELPKMYAGMSPCFRREAGTYGKDTHGLYRIHQFQKIEQVIVCKNDVQESAKMHEMILSNAKEVLEDLKLPYRVVAVCTGDIGKGQVYKNDIETWMPSRKSYGETHSCSTFYEFQARRLNLRYKEKDATTGKEVTKFCHTLNNTCVASPRILIPILEMYQNSDGSITIPEVLRPYMGGQEKITMR